MYEGEKKSLIVIIIMKTTKKWRKKMTHSVLLVRKNLDEDG